MSQIVDGHTYYDTRRCGGPIGAIRGSQRLSSVIFHGFWPFSLRDAAQSLPRLLPRVDRLLWPFFVGGFVARGCPRVELRAKNPKKTECGCGSRSSNLLARPVGCKTLARKRYDSSRLSIVRFATGPKRSMGHLRGGEKINFFYSRY